MSSKVVYDDSSIKSLKGADRVRKRPAAMLGSSGLSGARHGFTEIYGNALDEVSSGYGDRLDVSYYADGSISVRDYGRGVPLGWNESEHCYNWHNVYNELYAGGKYGKNQEALQRLTDADWKSFNEKDFNYLYSVGLNGLGAASTQYTSEFFEVRSYRGGKCTRMNFKRGIPIINGVPTDVFTLKDFDWHDLAPETFDTDEPDGTFVHWKPDSDVFTDINIGEGWVFSVCKDIAYVAGVTLNFEGATLGNHTINAGTIEDFVAELSRGKLEKDADGNIHTFSAEALRHGILTVEGSPFTWVCHLDMAFALTTKASPHSCFHNCVKMGGGAQYQGINNALYRFFSSIASSKGLKIEQSDYEGVLSVVASTKSNYASFKGQTKDEVDNSFILEIVSDTLYNKLNMEYGKGTQCIVDVVNSVMDMAIERIQIREAAKQIRAAKQVSRAKAPSKFATCKAYMKKDYKNAELWITEGDSAAGAVKQARNSDFQAVLPIRGKCLNVLKSSIDKIIKNQEIKDIFGLLGTGMDIGHEGLFDMSALKFDKIIFATDADEDGFQIRVLLFLIFYKLAPRLIKEGHIYIAETPRFEIKLINGEEVYALTDKERDALVAKYGSQVRSINRFKGLGEVNAPVLRKTTVHPDTRHLVPLTVNFDDQNVHDLIDALFGADKNHQRKKILVEVLGEDVASMLEENAIMFGDIDDSDIDEGIDYQVV